MGRVDAVLFDLDGTLVDSAPDLAGAANDLRELRGMAPLPYEQLRPMVGSGARGMVGMAFGLKSGDAGFDELREAFLNRYEQRMLQSTLVFAAMEPVLAQLEAMGLPWGIVTNKALRFARPVVVGLALHGRAGTLIGGDSTPHAKPHPAPLLEAARQLAVDPARCVYVRRRRPRRWHGHAGRGMGLPRPGGGDRALGSRRGDRRSCRALELARSGLNYEAQGPTWLRRGF